MTSTEILLNYVKKLSHPIKEIRERSLQLLVAKLRLGWQIDDELSGARELLDALLAWFHVQEPTLQREALQLLHGTLTTKAGNYIAKEYGAKQLLAKLKSVKHKIDEEAHDVYQDLIETIQFLNTVESENNINVPRLTLPSVNSSESDRDSSRDYLTGLRNDYHSSKDTSVSEGTFHTELSNEPRESDGIRLLLLPWVELSTSDAKTMLLVEDALKLLKSTRRCCRFISDVFLRDFPPEIFLNRPSIVQNLQLMSDTGQADRANEALSVLLCLTRALHKRIFELSSIDLSSDTTSVAESQESNNIVNEELRDLVGDSSPDLHTVDDLAVLKQWPAPIYALDTLHAVLTTMARSIVLLGPEDKGEDLDLKTLNICLSLIESLNQLVLECVNDSFWSKDHTSKTHRDIAHKSCMVMRLLGDLLMKYKKSFSEYPDRCQHRAAWIRLASVAGSLLHWSRHSALPPSSLTGALQAAQLDPALELFYPALNKSICDVLQSAKISVDQEYKTKYRELSRLLKSMDAAVAFMKNKNSCRSSKQVFSCIKESLPVIELHLNEAYINDVCDMLLRKTKYMDLNDSEWSLVRSIALKLMAHNVAWVSGMFYRQMADLVKSVLVDDDINQMENERSLTLLCDVSILTDICCHGLSSKVIEVASSASEVMVYFLRGRMVLSEICWWRLLASMLPILPLMQVYAAHDTEIGQAICKSLEPDIAECMGIGTADTIMGLVRLLFVQCVAVKLEAAHGLCQLLGDQRYLPPRETLRADILLNALRRIQPQGFNVDLSSSPSKNQQSTGLAQILDVLKQDIILDEHGSEYVAREAARPTLEPSLRRSTLQQLSVMMRQQETHETFLHCDGLSIIVAILRMSLLVDDYLAFPECAISCVSILNSICFASRHTLAKIQDLPSLLIRVILIFPANDSAVLLSAQVLALLAWSGFTLQELDAKRCQVPALPLSVVERTKLPFEANSYWNTSPNTEHSALEWLLTDEEFGTTLRLRWWCAWEGAARVVRGAPPPPAPLALRPAPGGAALLQAAAPAHAPAAALLALENATSHRQVRDALNVLESYVHLVKLSQQCKEFGALPWHHMRRFLNAPPASPRDTALLIAVLRFIVIYMDYVPRENDAHAWIKSCFIGKDASIISLLSRERLFPQQTAQDNIEVTQLHIHIVKVLLRCVILLETYDDFDSKRLESLVKILLACLERVDLRNFHMLGYLNELMRCIRYALHSRYCQLSEPALVECLKVVTRTLSGCAAGGGLKGQACRLDAMLALLALLRRVHDQGIPVMRWSEACEGDVAGCVLACAGAARASLRAAALHVVAQLARYAQLSPQLMQAIPSESLAQYAAGIFASTREANAVRAAAASMLTAITSRTSTHAEVLEREILDSLHENSFLENCFDIFVDFCSEKEYRNKFEPNVPVSILERRSELEVRAEKSVMHVTPSAGARARRAPTAALVAATADVIHNLAAFKRCPIQAWTEQGLYRLLFRCASWCKSSPSDSGRVRAATCRALVAASTHKCVRASLSSTKDCLHSVVKTLTPLDGDEIDADTLTARTQALLLVGSLLPDRSAGDSVWAQLKENMATPFFTLLLQCLHNESIALQDAGVFCLTQLAQSASNRLHPDKSRDESCVELLDNLKSPYSNGGEVVLDAGDGDDECQPEYMVEEICKTLMQSFQNMALQRNLHESSQDERWCRLSSCISSVLAGSARARRYCAHRRLAQALLGTLQAVRGRLAVAGAPLDAVRNADHNPTLRTLYWVLTMLTCSILDCPPAKAALVECGPAAALARLWPWAALTPPLRAAAAALLLALTHDCVRACSTMCTCVGGRSLLQEVCTMTCRETALQSRARSDALLLAYTRILRQCADHQHCRAVIMQSEALAALAKLRPGAASGAVGREYRALCAALARHADGAGAILALRPRAPLPALAHAAHHAPRRAACLAAPDLLEVFSGSLLTGDTADVVSAARAVWALAANNHKAKLILRSAHMPAAVVSAQQRLQRSADPASQRAVQLLNYTHTVLQTT